jgi:hypothetical protein
MFRGSLVRRRREPRISPPSPTTASDNAALSRSRKVEHLLTCLSVINDCAHWDLHLNRRSIVPGSVTAFTMPPPLTRMLRVEPQMEQRIVVFARNQDNVAPVSTVAAARTAARNIFFATKRETAVAAVTSLYRDCDLIDEQLSKLALRDDVDELAEPAAITKLDRTRNGGKQRVVFPQPHVPAGLIASATLAHDDRPTRYELA